MNRIAAVIAGLSLAFVGTSASFAGTINVPSDYPTIQGAINASSDGDVINIAPGTYNEHSLNPGGKAITIQGTLNGDESLATTIDAQQGSGVFSIFSGEGPDTVIKDLVITGGTGTQDDGYTFGGGIYCSESSNPTITDCTISGNTAISGGGIYWGYSSNPTITGCTISGNTAGEGGGISCDHSNLTITDCTISENSANFGSGIYCFHSNPTITDCTISDNMATNSGGGIYCNNSSPTITHCTISGNTAYDLGGGIYHSPSSSSILTDTIVCDNTPEQIIGSWTDNGGNTVQAICPIPPMPLGACCTGNERFCVQDAEELDCLFWGGEWLGEVTTCDECPPLVGPDPVGACCLGGTCMTGTESDCTAADGTYAGDDVACADAGCAWYHTDVNNNGCVDIDDLLYVIEDWNEGCTP